MTRFFVLADTAIRKRCADFVLIEAGDGHEVSIRPPRRNADQNAKFHAICSDIAKAGVLWAGKPRKAEAWKVLLVSGHAVATKEGADVIPGLEGEFINVRESTAAMSKARGASLIEYAIAFATSHGLEVWPQP